MPYIGFYLMILTCMYSGLFMMIYTRGIRARNFGELRSDTPVLMWLLLSNRYGLSNDECASYISTLNLRDTEYGPECAALERFSCRTTKLSSRYRSFDGSCNNPVRSSWGQGLTGYKRLLHPRYADGIGEVC